MTDNNGNKGKKAGRPSKFSKKRTDILLEAIRTGISYKRACHLAGISYVTFRRWKERAEQGEKEYFGFLDQLELAEIEAELIYLKTINRAAKKGHWRAAVWLLERRNPEDFHKK